MRELIEKLQGIPDLTENYGEIVVPKAGMKAHYGEVLGVFWYDTKSNKLDYSSGSAGHDTFKDYKEYFKTPGMVRGRLGRDEDGTIYILIYVGDFEGRPLAGDTILDLYKQVSEVSKVHINFVVDELGRDLIEGNLKEQGFVGGVGAPGIGGL
jgi:hypothetical protein